MSLFVVMSKGLEYNDETYTIGGEDASVHDQSFATIDEAREFARKKLASDLANHNLYDFDDYSTPDDGRLVARYCLSHGDDEDNRWSGHRNDYWSQLIEWADTNQLDWTKGAPQLLEIIEINEPV